MQPIDQTSGVPVNRPSARFATVPGGMQRGNYGLPPRPIARPIAPLAAAPAFVPTPAPVAAPAVQQPAPAVASQPAPIQQRPLFTPSATPAQTAHKPIKHFKLLTVSRIALAGLAVLLIIGGIGRWATAGSTTGDTIAVGAVSANDGRSMTIQFTATDGQMHKFSTKSNADLIPGSAVQLAYRSGAPEASVRQVSSIKNARNLGINIVLLGMACGAFSGIIAIFIRLKHHGKHRSAPLTTPALA